MRSINGIGASPGVAIGPAFHYQQADLNFTSFEVDDIATEWKRMQTALDVAAGQLRVLREKTASDAGEEQAAIFDAHLQMLTDPDLTEGVQSAILDGHRNAESAWMEISEQYARKLEALSDEYFRARAADIRDVARRTLRILLGKPESEAFLKEPAVVVARDLAPSDTVRFDKSMLLGFCTAEGGATSHTAILAKALALPAVVGAGADVLEMANAPLLIINGQTGEIVAEPDQGTLAAFEDARRLARDRDALELAAANKPAVTKDGRRVEVVANVGSISDSEQAIHYGAEGIGLLRTEFLYLERQTAPTEDEQYEAYKAIFTVQGDRPVVIRTLDVGGDKALPYIDLGHEENPFLGWRAIRMCLDNPEFFKTQIRAILRAAEGHDIRIMFPMIASVSEVRAARRLLEDARTELRSAGKRHAEKVQVGIMVEIPAAAVMADKFVEVVDFFSIGTNDLTQYSLAVERTNKKVAHLSNALDPAVLRLISQVITEGHKGGVWVGMCGELAGDPRAIPILLGLGLDEFSMAPAMVPHAKAVIRASDTRTCADLASKILNMSDYAEIRAFIAGDS